ncbi:MAG: glycosyltransferase [bacterium]
MKSVLIMNECDLDLDGRFQRQIKILSKNNFRITVLGYKFDSCKKFSNVEFIEIDKKKVKKLISLKSFFRSLKLFKYYYFSLDVVINVYKELKKRRFDVILVNDTFWVPLAYELKKIYGCKLILDAHEYYPLEFEEDQEWVRNEKPFKEWIVSTYYPKADIVFTVSYSIAEKYKQVCGIDPVVFMNTPYYHDLKPIFSQGDVIKIVHHGGAIKSRKIENIIKAMEYTSKNVHFHLYLIIPREKDYYQELLDLAKKFSNVEIFPPFKPDELIFGINSYDVGLVYFYPSNFNYKNALPNKFFEYIQARVPVICVDTPDITRLVKQYDIGWILEDYDPLTIAKVINSLDKAEINRVKSNVDLAARELCIEKQMDIFLRYFY